MSRTLKRILKVFLWIVAGLIVLVIGLLVFLSSPAGQNFIKGKVITYLKKKTNTEISLDKLSIDFPTQLELNKLYIEDKKNDTLLYAERLLVDLDMWKILKNKVELQNIELDKVRANIYRLNPDTIFNYQFLVDSLLSNQKKPENEVQNDTTAAIKFNLEKIVFNDVRLKYADDVVGNDAGIFIGKLDANVSKFDLSQMHYVLDKFTLSNTQLLYGQKKPLTVLQQVIDEGIDETEKENAGRLPLIEFKNFNLDSVSLNYDDRLSDTRATANLNETSFKNLLLDLTNGHYKSTDGILNNSVIDFAYRPTIANEEALSKAADSTKDSKFSLHIDKISLANNKIKYDNLSMPQLRGVLDYNHLNITGLGIAGSGIVIDSGIIKGQIEGGKLADSSGFVLDQLKGNVVYDDKQIRLDNFLLKTPLSYIENTSVLNYTSQDDLSKNPGRVKMAVNFRPSVVHMRDVHYLSHSVPADYRNQKINLAAAFTGYLNNIDIAKLQVSGLKSTQVDVAGKILGLPDAKNARYDLNIRQLKTSKADVLAFVPKSSIPSSINLPNYITANGTFKGSATNFNTNLNVRTDMGAARLNGLVNLAKGRETYNAKVNLNNFDLGRLLKQKDLGRVSLAANVNGRGLDAKRINAKINGTIYSAAYNGYTYRNLKLDGNYAGQNLAMNVNSADPNANFSLSTNIGMAGQSPSLKGDLDLRLIDLQKLGFVKDELQLSGAGTFDFSNISPDYLNGNAYFTGLQIVKDGETIRLDTVSLAAVSTPTGNTLDLVSEVITAHLEGKYQLTKIGQAFINEINKYYEIGDTKTIAEQRIKFDINVRNGRLIQDFVPKLTHISPSSISGLLDTQRDSLIVNGDFPHIVYDSFDVKNTILNIDNRKGAQLDYALNIKSFESPSIQLYNSDVNGAAANNRLGVNVFLRDSKNNDKYMVGGNFTVRDKTYQFSLDPDKLLLNYDKWTVAPDNLIQYGQEGVYVRNFEISNSGQMLSVISTSSQPNSPVKATFTNFKLETLTRYADQDTAMIGGILNGNVTAQDLTTNPKFEGDLDIAGLRFKKDSLGNASIKVNNYTSNAYQADVVLSGIHDIRINGLYYTAPTSSIDAKIDINRIDLKHIESLSGGQIRNGSGTLTGNLTAKGALSAPQISGDLRFNNAAMTVAKLNSYFRIEDETVSVSNEGIQLNTFTIKDSLGQSAVLDGMIYTKNFTDYAFDLNVNAKNFRALNSTDADNELFYGTVFIDLDAHVGGDLNKPEVTFDAKINEDTKFSFVIPDSNPAEINQRGIVEFIDVSDSSYTVNQPINVDSLTRSRIRGMDVSGNLSIDKNAEITIVVDPQNGDALKVKGQADLSVQLDPSGKTSLTGRYEISDGSYTLNIGGMARREFKLQQGSSVQWTGAPTEANIDITAVYEANVPPIDLVADQVQGFDQATRTTYRQRMPFLVYLKMSGELLQPQIKFELDMPENERNAFNGIVYTRIQQVNSNESDLNKQVFALLALNRFVSDNPFQSLAGGVTVNSLARQSVSKLLTEQLNNLASDLIQGVDINFELNSGMDYTTGTEQARTDLEVGLTKRLLNDRLSVTVGNNFALEGSQANTQAVQLASNVNIEYMLSKDGRYRLRAYRRNRTEGIIEGQIIETGVGFVMVVDYNRFREIFESFEKRGQRDNTGKRE